jgi:peptide/nickel transport system substrate-binding protein
LKELKIDVGGGETFQPYDPDVPKKVAEWAKKQGYTVPSDPEGLRDRFGMGWWKFAPDVAEKLLKKAGLTKSAQGKWQTADGKPFKISILAAPDEQDVYRLAIGAQDQWRKFGIEVDVEAVERDPYYTRNNTGDFNVISGWGQAGGGLSVNAIADKWQAIQGLHSRYFTKIGDSTAATGSNNTSRFKFPEIDKIIDQLAAVHPDDPKALELGRDFMKFWVENMVGITTISFKKFITIDEYYFTGFPTSEKPGRQPLYWFIGGRFSLPLVEPVKK